MTDGMILAAARTLGEHSPALRDPSASLLPALADLRKIAIEIATTVGIEAVREGVGPKATPDEIRQRVIATQWTPTYAPFLKS